jgi:uroporphyrinogen decarboxylase
MSEMSPKERIGNFLTGKPIDRVPCVPLILNHCARVLGVKVSEYAKNGAVMGAANVAAYRRYGQDLITIFTDTSIVAEALGTELMFPDDDVSRVAKPAVVDPDDLARMKPVDVLTAGRLPVYLEAIRHCVKEVGDEVFVSCCIPAPFSTAAALRGTAIFARDLYRNRALAMALLEKAEAATADMCAAVARAGGIPVLVDPVASGSVISPKAFAEFAAPGIVSVNKKIQSLGMPAILHICGKTSGIVAAMVDTGAAVVSLDAISLAEAREKIGKRACIMGNVAPAQTLLEGTSEIVRREAERCLAECGDNPGGFILASGCEVPIETPPANIDAMIGVARRSAR